MKKTFTRTETIQIDLIKGFPELFWDTVHFERAKIKDNRYLEIDITFVLEIEDDRSKRDTNRGDNRT